MYLKIIGIVLIMMSASLMGYLFSKDYIERINRLGQIQKMLIQQMKHNLMKTIQKAIESYRITSEQKEYLRTLRIKREKE